MKLKGKTICIRRFELLERFLEAASEAALQAGAGGRREGEKPAQRLMKNSRETLQEYLRHRSAHGC